MILSDIEIYSKEYINSLNLYELKIDKEYDFVYKKFFNELLLDIVPKVKSNHDREYYSEDYNEYRKAIFKSSFYNLLRSEEWYYKLKTPNEFPEFKKINRLEKLKRLQNDSTHAQQNNRNITRFT